VCARRCQQQRHAHHAKDRQLCCSYQYCATRQKCGVLANWTPQAVGFKLCLLAGSKYAWADVVQHQIRAKTEWSWFAERFELGQ
jgi:hypothetical protein